MKRIAVVLTLLLSVALRAGEAPEPPADQPSPKGKPWWDARHKELVEASKKTKADVLFIGDSITERWAQEGKDVWAKSFAPLNAFNDGVGGDRTEQVLWRIANGEIDGQTPKVVVILIGINNTWTVKGNEIEAKGKSIAGGAAAIVKAVQEKMPKAKIVLHAVFPMADGVPPVVKIINEELAKLANEKKLRFFDIGAKFADKDGKVSKEIMHDGLHLSAKGYQIWADELEPVVKELMK
jgi:lysophospholipase L1-like esterase